MSTKSLCLFLALLFVLPLPGCRRAERSEVVICSFGGSFQEAQRKAFFEPFEKATGIHVRERNYSGEYARIVSMARSPEWDVVDVELANLLTGAREGRFERIDYGRLNVPGLMEEAKNPYGVATDFYSTGIAWKTDSRIKTPGTWRDFWDLRQFPGSRSLRKNPYTLLEMALLADGVGPSELYPLDIDRAFRSLDRVKRNIKVWWTTGQQPVQLLATGEVDFTTGWSGRIWNARHRDNLPLSFSYRQALLEPEWWVVLKGAKNKQNALRFIEFASQAKPQAEMAKAFGVGPTNTGAFDYLPKELVDELPTSPQNIQNQILVDGTWWSENLATVNKRWDSWLLE